MRFRTTLRLFLAVCVLAGAIWFSEQRSASEAKKRELTYSLFAVKGDEILDFSLERGTFHVTCIKDNGIWQIKSPLNARADEGEIKRILNLFESIPKEEIITSAQRRARGLSLSDYGLLDYRARVVLTTRLGVRDVLMGYDAPLGDLMYVMYAGGSDVIAVHKSFFGIIPDQIEKLRDRSLLHGEASETSRLEIQRQGLFIQLAQVEGKWMIRQPIIARADGGTITRLLDSLYEMKASSFVWDPIIRQESDLQAPVDMQTDTAVATETYSLRENDASARVTVWVNGDEVGKELIFGGEVKGDKDKVYAKLRDKESIYSVEKKMLDILAVTIQDIRDHALYSCSPEEILEIRFEQGDKKLTMSRNAAGSDWMIVDPVKWRADNTVVRQTLQQLISLRAQSYIDGGVTNQAGYGLDPCSFSITMSKKLPTELVSDPADAKTAVKSEEVSGKTILRVGALANEGKFIFTRFEKSSEIMTVPVADLARMALNPVDPMVYMDRTMLKVATAEVKRISLLKAGKEQVVVLDDKGEWKVSVASVTNGTANLECKVVPDVINNILVNSANLSAIRIEKNNPENLALYGLDKPSAVLTLGLASAAGIQKSVMIGLVTKAGDSYVMVQGQDVVFSLNKEVVAQLTRDLMELSVKPESNEEAR